MNCFEPNLNQKLAEQCELKNNLIKTALAALTNENIESNDIFVLTHSSENRALSAARGKVEYQ